MKIRNHRKYEWWLWPISGSKIDKGRCYIFKRKSALINFIAGNINDCIGGVVRLEHSCFNSSGPVREYTVWYNEYEYHQKRRPFTVVLKNEAFRGSKYIFKPRPISKEDKKYFAFSDKIMSLMCRLSEEKEITQKDANRLVGLFVKRGFKDFIPDDGDQRYIDFYLEKGIDFYHWSDRCGWLRMKTIIEYFRHIGLEVTMNT